jgi:hypothetical protein
MRQNSQHKNTERHYVHDHLGSNAIGCFSLGILAHFVVRCFGIEHSSVGHIFCHFFMEVFVKLEETKVIENKQKRKDV